MSELNDSRFDRLQKNPDASHCDACFRFHVLDDMVMYDLVSNGNDREYDKFFKQALQRVRRDCPALREKFALLNKKYNPDKSNHKHMGTWAGTLTMAPTDSLNEEDMVSAIKKIMNQKTCPLLKYAWYLEYTENGLPHIHFIYQTSTGGRIHKRVFQRVWKIWDESHNIGAGHRGGYHRECHSDEEYLRYISKDKGRCAVQWS